MSVVAPVRVGVAVSSPVDGGAETYLRALYTPARDLGIAGHLLGSIPRWDVTGLSQTDLAFGPKWGRRALLRSLRSLPQERRTALSTIRRLHSRSPFDVFHAQYKREQILLTSALARLAPVVWTEHGRFVRGAMGRALATGYRLSSRHAAAIICVSEGVRDDLAEICGPNPPDLVVIPNPVDAEHFRPSGDAERRHARDLLGIRDSTGPVIAVVSRLHPAKRIDLAVEAIRRVDGGTLVIAGDGPDRQRLEALATGASVRFVGHLADPRAVYAAADAFVLTSGPAAREGLPMSLLEAGACQLPLVVTTGAGLDRDVRVAGGLLVDPEAGQLAAALSRAALTPRAGAAARSWAREHDASSWLARHRAVLDEAIARGRTSRQGE